MGFFDKIKKIGKVLQKNMSEDIKNSINNITKDIDNTIKPNINNTPATITSLKYIPDTYSQFPTFDGNAISLYEKNTPNYIRCTMDYKNVSSLDFEDYLYEITNAGFIQESNVRYEKNNTYIIVEYSGTLLHLVFHIKK